LFKNGQPISGQDSYKYPNIRPTTFSEFTLFICGKDTIIDFWGAVLSCRTAFDNDTLTIHNLKNLPTAQDRQFQTTIWTSEKIYFENGNLRRQLTVNRKIYKYNREEILQTIEEFETAEINLNDNKMELANRLFISTISGDQKARQYFKEFKTRFGVLDGAFKEEYNDLTAMLRLWDKGL